MTPLYLECADEASMWEGLTELGLVAEHEGERYITCEHSIIGPWFERIGGTDEEPEFEQVGAWHFNLLLPEVPELPAGFTRHAPQTPWRVWGQ